MYTKTVLYVSFDIDMESLISFVYHVESYAYSVKQWCKNSSADGLTIVEWVSIMLYLMDWKTLDNYLYNCFKCYSLQSEDKSKFQLRFLHLKLFLTTLTRCSSTHKNVYREAKVDLSQQYQTDETIVWWGFSFYTTLINVSYKVNRFWIGPVQEHYWISNIIKEKIFTISTAQSEDNIRRRKVSTLLLYIKC